MASMNFGGGGGEGALLRTVRYKWNTKISSHTKKNRSNTPVFQNV